MSSMRRSRHALPFIPSDGLYHASSCSMLFMVDHLLWIDPSSLSRTAQTGVFLHYGQRWDTMSTNISGFLFIRNLYTNSISDSPNIPTAMKVNHEYVLIYLACNDSPEIIKSVMENKLFHAECRKCMNNPKAMESAPSWIRVRTRNARMLPPVSNLPFYPSKIVLITQLSH